MHSPLVSFIVAVYNAEKFLPRCLDSLLGQTYSNIEVIAVDDASTDGSLDILKGYADRYSCLHVLQMKNNSGAVAARNKGISIANGELMTFVDADDCISFDAIERTVCLFEQDEEIDIVTYQVLKVRLQTEENIPIANNPNVPKIMTGREACYWTIHWDIPGLSVARTSLEKRFCADSKCGQYEDETMTHLLFFNARKVVIGSGIYYYYENPQSYTNSISYKRFEILECRLSLRKKLLAAGADCKILSRLEVKRWYELLSVCFLFHKHKSAFTEDECGKIMERLKRTYHGIVYKDLPLRFWVLPLRMVMPSFPLFYLQAIIKGELRNIFHRKWSNSIH